MPADFEGGGCATLTDMYTAQSVADGEVGEGPLYVLNELDEVVGGTPTGYWLLDRNVRVVDGVTLFVHGTEINGDADVLRIKSTSEEFYELRGYGGSLSFHTTKVTSWDTENGEEKEWTSGEGRSFINCVTQFDDSETWDCEGASNQEWGECRMVGHVAVLLLPRREDRHRLHGLYFLGCTEIRAHDSSLVHCCRKHAGGPACLAALVYFVGGMVECRCDDTAFVARFPRTCNHTDIAALFLSASSVELPNRALVHRMSLERTTAVRQHPGRTSSPPISFPS